MRDLSFRRLGSVERVTRTRSLHKLMPFCVKVVCYPRLCNHFDMLVNLPITKGCVMTIRV